MKRRWWRRVLFWLSVVLLLGIGGAVIWLRANRGKHEPAVMVNANAARVRNLFVDFYAARAGAHVIVFDTGIDRDGAAADALLAQLGKTRDDVSDVFITHGHGDHVSGIPIFKNAKVNASSKDVDMIRDRSLIEPFAAIVSGWLLPVPDATATATDAGDVVVDKDQDLKVRVFDLPGHTQGSQAFLYDGVLYVGDSMGLRDGKLTAAAPVFSVDLTQNKRSIQALGQALDKALSGAKLDFVCTGHQACTPPDQAQSLLHALASSP